MKKLLSILAMLPALAVGQTYNVSVTNSLLGPVDLNFTDTVVQASGEITLTGAVFNTSVTNSFAPVNNVTNEINVGDTIITNIYAEGAFQTTISNNVEVAGVVVTNNITIDQATYITNLIDQFVGVNVFTPFLASTNVSGTWTIDLTTNAAVAIYEQIGNVTQVLFNVDNTNDVALAEILLLATTNSITWPTNGLTWAAGSDPTPTASEYNRIYFEAWRDYVYAVFVGANP